MIAVAAICGAATTLTGLPEDESLVVAFVREFGNQTFREVRAVLRAALIKLKRSVKW